MLATLVRPWAETSSASAQSWNRALFVRAYHLAAVLFVGSYRTMQLAKFVVLLPAATLSRVTGIDRALKRRPYLSIVAVTAALFGCAAGAAGRLPVVVPPSALFAIAYFMLCLHGAASVALHTHRTMDHATLADLRTGIESNPLLAWFSRRMRHPEDAVWLRSMSSVTLAALPIMALLATPFDRRISWVWFVCSVLVSYRTMGIADHNVGHYVPFRAAKRAPLFDRIAMRSAGLYFDVVVTFLDCRVPFVTKTLHNIHHHGEDNGADDFESTYPFDRTSFVDCSVLHLNCLFSYCFALDSIRYLWRKRKFRQLRELAAGLIINYGVLALWAVFDWRTALFVGGVRLAVNGYRHGQLAYITHPLVDPEAPEDIFRNSVDGVTNNWNLLATEIHMLHHRFPGRHWTVIKDSRRERLNDYPKDNFSIYPQAVLDHIQPLLFARRFDVLARHALLPSDIASIEDGDVSPLGHQSAPDAEELERRMAVLRTRSRPADASPAAGLAALVDRLVARILLASVPRALLERSGPDSAFVAKGAPTT